MFFSKTTMGFYDKSLHENIPTDAKQISETLYKQILMGQCEGKVIAADSEGFPKLEDTVVTDTGLDLERMWRNSELNRADIELYKVQDSDINSSGTVSMWRQYRKELRSWPEHLNFPDKNFRPIAPDYKG